MGKGELVSDVEQNGSRIHIYVLAIEHTAEFAIVEIAVQNGGPPFRHGYLRADGYTGILTFSDIAVANDGGMTGLLKGLREEILCIAVVEGCSQKMIVCMGSLYVLGILGLEIRIAGLVGILVQEEEEGVEVLVRRAIDTAAIVKGDLVLVVDVIA